MRQCEIVRISASLKSRNVTAHAPFVNVRRLLFEGKPSIRLQAKLTLLVDQYATRPGKGEVDLRLSPRSTQSTRVDPSLVPL